jgi:uncharacterized protein (TIGR03066 family)
MRWSRFAVAGCLVLGLTLVATAGTDNAKKLLGKWKVTKSDTEGTVGSTTEFQQGGKLKLHLKVGDKDIDLEGSYKVKGDKLTGTLSFKGKSKSFTHKIKSLSANKLVIENESGKTHEFTRVKKKE